MMDRAKKWGLLIASVGLVLTGSAFGESPVKKTRPIGTVEACLHLLPDEVSRVLSEQFGDWIVQHSDALSSVAKERWQAERPMECPGIAGGRFISAKSKSLAVLIVGSGKNKGQARLLSFTQDGANYHMSVLEQISSGAINYFVHSARTRQFFDAASARRFRAAASESVVLFDAGTDEYGVEVYYWTEAGFRHESVDY